MGKVEQRWRPAPSLFVCPWALATGGTWSPLVLFVSLVTTAKSKDILASQCSYETIELSGHRLVSKTLQVQFHT